MQYQIVFVAAPRGSGTMAAVFWVAAQCGPSKNRLISLLRLSWKRSENNRLFRPFCSLKPCVAATLAAAERKKTLLGWFAARNLQKEPVVFAAAPPAEAERKQPFFGRFAARSFQETVVFVAAWKRAEENLYPAVSQPETQPSKEGWERGTRYDPHFSPKYRLKY